MPPEARTTELKTWEAFDENSVEQYLIGCMKLMQTRLKHFGDLSKEVTPEECNCFLMMSESGPRNYESRITGRATVPGYIRSDITFTSFNLVPYTRNYGIPAEFRYSFAGTLTRT